MRILLIIMAVLVVLFTISQIYGPMFGGTEEQAYSVVQRYDELEIRHYPQALMASVDVPDSAYRSASGTGFRRLAGYIFGDNETGEKIAMTAPVHMGMEEGSMRMSFVMPAERAQEPMPDPVDSGVQLHVAAEEFVAVLRFGGFLRDAEMTDMKAKLLAELERNGLVPIGPVRFLGYDPPWQLVGRRNEVVVPVRWPQP
ncbi:MAG: heme-binding protein [Flavobacteriales bacterium]